MLVLHHWHGLAVKEEFCFGLAKAAFASPHPTVIPIAIEATAGLTGRMESALLQCHHLTGEGSVPMVFTMPDCHVPKHLHMYCDGPALSIESLPQRYAPFCKLTVEDRPVRVPVADAVSILMGD